MSGLLTMRGVTCRFGRFTALDRVDLEIPQGQRRAVIGPNGAGKSTLVGVIAGTTRAQRGQVVLAGRDLTRLSPARRVGRGVVRTFQTPAVADSLTVRENLYVGAWRAAPGTRRIGRRRQAIRRADEQLANLGLAALGEQPASRLSHGQRRLLEIGMALAAGPRLLLLDEPAAGLTDADLPRLLQCLRQLPAEVAVLLVEHHLDVVEVFAERVTVLHQGRILVEGTPAEVYAHPEVAEVYLGNSRPAGKGL